MNPEKVPPHNESIEAAALAAMMQDITATDIAADELRAADFYLPQHRLIFGAIMAVYKTGVLPEEILVKLELERSGKLEAAGGRDFLGQVYMAGNAAGIESYAAELREQTERRGILTMVARLADELKPDQSLEIISETLDTIHARRCNVTGEPQDLHALAVPLAKEALEGEDRDFWGLRTGLATNEFDGLTGGVQANQYWVIAARTAMGKSTLVRDLATGLRRMNPAAGLPLILSTEMGEQAIARGALASAAGVAVETLLRRRLSEEQRERVQRIINEKTLEGVRVSYESGLTIPKIRAIARRHKRRHGLPLLVIDMAGQVNGQGQDERERLVGVSKGLMALKGELDTCLLACVQVSRAVYLNDEKRPDLKDLKGSGTWEEDADRVLFIHRPAAFGKSDLRTEVIQAKDRITGRVGSVFLSYRVNEGRYESAEGNGYG